MKKILDEIEKIQVFIEKQDAVDRRGRRISDFEKLALVQEDLSKLQKMIKSNIKENKK